MRKLRLRYAQALSQLASSSDPEQVLRNSVFCSFLTLFKNKRDDEAMSGLWHRRGTGEALKQLQMKSSRLFSNMAEREP